MGFVDHQQGVARQVVVEGGWWLARATPGQVAAVVLDAVAIAQFEDHLQIEAGALLQALGLEQAILAAQPFQAIGQFQLDVLDGAQQGLARCGVVGLGIEGEARQLADHLAGQGIEGRQALHLVVEQLDAHGFQVGFRREDVDDVAAHPEGGAGEFHVVAAVLQLGQPAQDGALVDAVTAIQVQDHLQVGLGTAQAIDGGHRGDDDGVLALQQRLGGGQAHLLDVVVDGRILLDEGVRRGHIGFRLVVVVVGDEILHRVVREEGLEFAIELRGQGLVRRQHHGRALHLGDDVGDAEGLARAGHAEQGLVRQTRLQAFHHLANGFGLVAGRGVAGGELECGHGCLNSAKMHGHHRADARSGRCGRGKSWKPLDEVACAPLQSVCGAARQEISY